MMISDLLGTPHFHVLCLVLMSTAAIEGLIAIWAATSPRHWFWRAIAVWAGIAILLPIRAYQPAVVFGISSPLTISLIRGLMIRRATLTGRVRFGLRDVLLATALVGLALATLLHLLPRVGRIPIAELVLTVAGQTAISVLA